MSSRRKRARFDRSLDSLRVTRNVEALRCLEADIINTQLRRSQRLTTLNRLASDVHLTDLSVRRADFIEKYEAEIYRVRAEHDTAVADAKTRYQQQLDEHRALLQEALATAAASESRARVLADRERAHYEREAEYRLFTECESLRSEYKRLHSEVSQLKNEQEQSRRNREEIDALRAKLEKKRPHKSKPQPRLAIDEKRQKLRE